MIRAGLVIERIGVATVQDLGRPGHMHEGVPPGGALVPELLIAANRSLGNPDGAAALELPLSSARVRAVAPIVVSVDGTPHRLAADEVLDIPSGERAIRYLALPGGVDVPVVLGGRGTLLVAQLGGLDGRPLRRCDFVPCARSDTDVDADTDIDATDAADATAGSVAPVALDPGRPIRVVRGPDRFPDGAFDELLTGAFQVSPAMDRTGMRLAGATLTLLPDDRPASAPMVRGAIQVTVDGTPIVLGPDHPTTGGYPVIAVVHSDDLGRLASRRPGATVRFVEAPFHG